MTRKGVCAPPVAHVPDCADNRRQAIDDPTPKYEMTTIDDEIMTKYEIMAGGKTFKEEHIILEGCITIILDAYDYPRIAQRA